MDRAGENGEGRPPRCVRHALFGELRAAIALLLRLALPASIEAQAVFTNLLSFEKQLLLCTLSLDLLPGGRES